MLQPALRLKPDGVGVVVVGAEAVGTEATPTTVGVGMAAIPTTGTAIPTVGGVGGVRVSGLGSASKGSAPSGFSFGTYWALRWLFRETGLGALDPLETRADPRRH
jgi:hypothetical protein